MLCCSAGAGSRRARVTSHRVDRLARQCSELCADSIGTAQTAANRRGHLWQVAAQRSSRSADSGPFRAVRVLSPREQSFLRVVSLCAWSGWSVCAAFLRCAISRETDGEETRRCRVEQPNEAVPQQTTTSATSTRHSGTTRKERHTIDDDANTTPLFPGRRDRTERQLATNTRRRVDQRKRNTTRTRSRTMEGRVDGSVSLVPPRGGLSRGAPSPGPALAARRMVRGVEINARAEATRRINAHDCVCVDVVGQTIPAEARFASRSAFAARRAPWLLRSAPVLC